jgi:succinoglycan biosynthesis transport protein ExoP
MELLHYWKIIRKSLWLIVLLMVVALAATWFYSSNQPTHYESSSILLLNPSVPNSLIPQYQTQAAAGLADSYTALMSTRAFGDSVVKDLPFEMSSEQVSQAITAKLTSNTLFFTISAQMDSPEKAQQLVSTTVKVLLSTVAPQETTGTGQSTDPAKSDMRQRLNDKLQYLGDQIKSYQAEIKGLASQPPSADRDAQLLQFRGQLVTLEQTETDTMVAIAQLSDNSPSPVVASVIDQPLPGTKVPSRLLTNLELAFVVSLLLGVGLAFFRDYLDSSIHSPEQLGELVGLAPLAVIGTVRRSRWPRSDGRRHDKERQPQSAVGQAKGLRPANPALIALNQPGSAEAESFRTLRTNIQFASVAKPLRSIVVTSAVPMEGKTFVAANLAVAMAQTGKRVLLVDSDLRRPSVHTVFDLPNGPGLTNMILYESLAGIVQRIFDVPNLMVITSGPLPPNPSETLDSERLTRVMGYLAEHADLVIYDSPPATVVTDPAILGVRADAVILVARARATRRDLILGAKQALERVGVEVILPVLNTVAPRDMGTYQGYYRNYRTSPAERQNMPPNEHGARLDSDASSEITASDGYGKLGKI